MSTLFSNLVMIRVTDVVSCDVPLKMLLSCLCVPLLDFHVRVGVQPDKRLALIQGKRSVTSKISCRCRIAPVRMPAYGPNL